MGEDALQHRADGAVSTQPARKLAPSDFAFLWDECRRCFYLKVALGIDRPRTPMPSIFSVIDSKMKGFFQGRRTEEVAPMLAPGSFAHFGRWVESAPIRPPGAARMLYVRGPFDTVIAFDDGTHAIIDFKTSSQKSENVAKYARQLQAYAHALENPAHEKAFALPNVRRMGLLVYEPDAFHMAPDGGARLGGSVKWIEIPRDDAAFLAFLGDVSAVLDAPAPPPADPECAWCRHRAATRAHAH